jgi:hypothetical protein
MQSKRNEKLDIKNWNFVSSDTVKIFYINKYISDFVYSNKRDYKKIFKEFLVEFNDDKKDLVYERFWNFIIKFDFNSLKNLLKIDTINISGDNELLKCFLDKNLNYINMEKREIVKNFSRSIQTTLYYHSVEYFEKNGNSTKDSISLKKQKMIDDVQNILNRSQNIIDFLNGLSEYYKKHKIIRSIMLDDLIELDLNFDEFKKLCNIYLRCYIKSDKSENLEDSKSNEKNESIDKF